MGGVIRLKKEPLNFPDVDSARLKYGSQNNDPYETTHRHIVLLCSRFEDTLLYNAHSVDLCKGFQMNLVQCDWGTKK